MYIYKRGYFGKKIIHLTKLLNITLLRSFGQGDHPTVERDVLLSEDITGDTTSDLGQTLNPLPTWLWVLLVNVAGLKSRAKSRTWLAFLLCMLTYLSALVYVATHSWNVIFDVARNAQPPLHGVVSIMLVAFWCTIGIYARHLTRCLLNHPNIRKGVQLVCKSIFRMNAAVLITLFSVSLLVVNNFSAKIHLDMQQRENGKCFEKPQNMHRSSVLMHFYFYS